VNFEQLLDTRDARKTNKVRLPYGYLYKRQIDGKYSNFVEFHDELADNISFSRCVYDECEALSEVADPHQLRFTPNAGGEGVYAIAIESGNYLTFEQLLNEQPAMVAQGDFISRTIEALVRLTSTLNGMGIQHLCFAPSNVLVRKSDGSVRLLCHGSFYQRLYLNAELYDGVEQFVAPEVLRNEMATDSSDVYSLARFIEYLYASSGVPFEFKAVLKKATVEVPDKRYATVDAMLGAMTARKNLRRSVTLGIAAVAIALIVMGIFFEAVPNTEPVEFVKPVKEPINEDLLDEGFDPLTELGPDADSATIARAIQEYMRNDSDKVDEKKIREFEAKAEQIFRKQYSAAADQILSKIYNNERMNNTEKNFQASSAEVMKELVKKQEELSSKSSISGEKAQRIASEIIEQITEKKKAALEAKAKEKEQEKNNQE
jgi:serine/threonine protein kinase